MQTGKLYLIPVPIHDEGENTIPEGTLAIIRNLRYIVAERGKTARKFIKQLCPELVQSSITVEEMTDDINLKQLVETLSKGTSIGIMSEAGNPCIADPGHKIVSAAHKAGIDVVALTGPSSILLALIGSGFNGQQFTFHGYLPNKKDALLVRLRSLEQTMIKTGYTQIFMETPYRNHFVWDVMMSAFSEKTSLCVGADLGSDFAMLKTQTVAGWKKTGMPDLQKKPTIFLIGNQA